MNNKDVQQPFPNCRDKVSVDPWKRKILTNVHDKTQRTFWTSKAEDIVPYDCLKHSIMFKRISYVLPCFAGLVRDIAPTQICKLSWFYVFFHMHYLFPWCQSKIEKKIYKRVWNWFWQLCVRWCTWHSLWGNGCQVGRFWHRPT